MYNRYLDNFHTIQESRSEYYISLSSPLAPGLATAWWWRTSPRPPLGRTSRTSCARPARSTTPTLTRAAVARASLSLGHAATWSKFMDSFRRKGFSIVPSPGTLLTNWTVPSWADGESGSSRRARVAVVDVAGPAPGPGEQSSSSNKISLHPINP